MPDTTPPLGFKGITQVLAETSAITGKAARAANLGDLVDAVAATGNLRHQQPGGATLPLPAILEERLTPLKQGVPMDASPDDTSAVAATTTGMQALFDKAATRTRRRVDLDGRRFPINAPISIGGDNWDIDAGGAQWHRRTNGGFLHIDVTTTPSYCGVIRDLDLFGAATGSRSDMAGVRFFTSIPGTGQRAGYWNINGVRATGLRHAVRFDEVGYDPWPNSLTGAAENSIQRHAHNSIRNLKTDPRSSWVVTGLTAGTGTHTLMAPDRPLTGIGTDGIYTAVGCTFTAAPGASAITLSDAAAYAALRDGDYVRFTSAGTLPAGLWPDEDYQLTKLGSQQISLIRLGIPTEAIRWMAGTGAHNMVEGGSLSATHACVRAGNGVSGCGDFTIHGGHYLNARYGVQILGPADQGRYARNDFIMPGQFDAIKVNPLNLENLQYATIGDHNAPDGVENRFVNCVGLRYTGRQYSSMRVGLPNPATIPQSGGAASGVLWRIDPTPAGVQYVSGAVDFDLSVLANGLDIAALRSRWMVRQGSTGGGLTVVEEHTTLHHGLAAAALQLRLELVVVGGRIEVRLGAAQGLVGSLQVKGNATTGDPNWSISPALTVPMMGAAL